MVLGRFIDSAFICFAALFAISQRVNALDAEQVFEKAAPSVVTIETYDATGTRIGLGSGVVIAAGEIATNCHVLQDSATVLVKKEGRSSPAFLRFSDKARDVCQLQASQATAFTRPVVGVLAMEDLRVGRRVYAIGAPRGLELTLSDGLISGLRQSPTGSIQLIQTTAPVSPGSSGGGLFDQEARLVGITTFILKESQNLNFAVPASWVVQLSTRQADLLDQRGRLQAQEHDVQGPSPVRPQALDYENSGAASAPDVRAYVQGVQDRIQRLISYPSDRTGRLRAEFALSVMASGWPVRVALVESSGDSEFDTNARAAIIAACPLHDAQQVQFEGVRNFRVVLRAVTAERVQSKADEGAALRRFQQDVAGKVGKFVSEQDYPRAARDNGWQGSTMVRVEIGQDGRLKRVNVVRSSGFSLLDERAVAKIREIQLPNVPDELREREFSVDVPFRFSLHNREP
jgi:TonB family protein